MKKGETIHLESSDAAEEAILDRTDAFTDDVIDFNNSRTRVNGTSGVAQEYPLPGFAENIRAFIKRQGF